MRFFGWHCDWFFFRELLEPIHLIPSMSLTWRSPRHSRSRHAELALSVRLWKWDLRFCVEREET
jgi:hypothetical protein